MDLAKGQPFFIFFDLSAFFVFFALNLYISYVFLVNASGMLTAGAFSSCQLCMRLVYVCGGGVKMEKVTASGSSAT